MYAHTIIGRAPYEPATELQACAANAEALLLAQQLDEYYKGDEKAFYRARIQATPYYYELQALLRPLTNPTTNATYKIIELLDFISRPPTSPLHVLQPSAPAAKAPLHVFFNCEMPGAMLKFTYDCLQRKGIASEFIASSLVDPVKKAFPDSYRVFASGLAKVLMNDTNNGDVTIAANVRDFRTRYGNWADVYISDGALNVEEDFGNIELRNMAIGLGQLLVGLCCLRANGILVYKTFTLTYVVSQSMVSLMLDCFDAVSVVKPETSRAANSEIYVVGMGYTPLSSARLDELIRYLELESLAEAGALCPIHPSVDRIQCELAQQQCEGLGRFIRALQGERVDTVTDREARARDWMAKYAYLLDSQKKAGGRRAGSKRRH